MRRNAVRMGAEMDVCEVPTRRHPQRVQLSALRGGMNAGYNEKERPFVMAYT
jgi:hypothetical protein